MTVVTECPACHAENAIAASEVGRERTCSACGRVFAAVEILGPPPPGMRPHRAGLILGLGTASLVVFGIFGPFAWFLGRRDLERMRRGEMDPAGMKNTQVGVTMGKIGTAKFVLEILLIAAAVAAILVYAIYYM